MLHDAAADFLSCLCGSELLNPCRGAQHDFLSCLCGSELGKDFDLASVPFLSCLCGSELERAGYMRGLLGHIEAAICACSAIHDRAMATGSWKPVPVTLAELDAITTMEDLHDMQLRQLTGGELATIVNKVIHEAQNEAVFMPPGDLQQAGPAA